MAKQQTVYKPGTTEQQTGPKQELVKGEVANFDALFSREPNSKNGVKSITLKRSFSRPMIAMAHQKELLIEFTSEMYEQQLAAAGRSDKLQPATLIDGVNIETGEDCVLILNMLMKGALQRATKGQGDAVLPLVGRAFGFRLLNAQGDKKYKIIETVEVAIER